MKRYVAPFLLIILLLSIFKDSHISEAMAPMKIKEEGRIVFAQDAEEKRGTDSHYIQLLKQIKEKVDGWLKSLNERIEREDVTRFEVRFLEILRNILEWVKEKIDSKIESSEEKKPEKQERGLFRRTHQTVISFSEIG